MCFDPFASTSWTASRSTTLPSPRVMRPLRSRIVIPSTWRVATFMLMFVSPLGLWSRLGRRSVFDECEFSARMQLAKVYLIHEGSDEEDAPAGAAEDVFRGEWVGETVGIETVALVSNPHDHGIGSGLERDGDLFCGAIGVAMQDGIDGGLADRHGDVGHGVFIESRTRAEVFRSLLH